MLEEREVAAVLTGGLTGRDAGSRFSGAAPTPESFMDTIIVCLIYYVRC